MGSVTIMTYDYRPALSDNQKLALEYIRQNHGCNVEDVVNFLVPFDHADELRCQIAQDVEFLIWNWYIKRNKRTHSLSVITDVIR